MTLFHEFGHLVHHVLAGRGEWARFSGVATEWDFVEAPSQMLEEWAWDADVLRTFAPDADGEPIPADLVAQMRARRRLRQGLQRADPDVLRRDVLLVPHRPARRTSPSGPVELQDRYCLFPYIEGTHMFAGVRPPRAATRRATTPTCGRW